MTIIATYDKKQFIKNWKHFLVDIDKNEKELGQELGTSASNINRKINSGTIQNS